MVDKIVQLIDKDGDNIYPVASVPHGASITMTDTDPGEGAALEADHYIGVYGDTAEIPVIGDVLSTPSDVAYVDTVNIVDGAVTADKIDFTTMKKWVPDYSNYGSTNLWASSSTTTITENGFVYAFINAYKTNANSQTNIKINGKIVAQSHAEARGPNNAVVCDCSGIFPVSAGDIVSYDVHSGNVNSRDCYFIPGKWV